MNIGYVREKVINDEYFYSRHGDIERQNDNLSVLDVAEAMLTGRVLEEYKDIGRGESCLIVGFTNSGKPVHVVCGLNENSLVIITVYIPGPPKFKNPYERG